MQPNTKPLNVLVTGPTGFIGRHLCAQLKESGHNVMAARHYRANNRLPDILADDSIAVGEINSKTDWSQAMNGIDVVVHLAARVHVMQEHDADPLTAYREINTFGTERLASAAAAAGVRRMVFVSTIKVNGETTTDRPFNVFDTPCPVDAYAISKWEAEQSIWRIGRETGLEVVVVRPPLVYGPGVKGNFIRLLKLVKRGIPLPLGACINKRSLVGLSNITDLLIQCLTKQEAAGHTFLVSDDEDLSTTDLIRGLAASIRQKPRLISIPAKWLEVAARAVGKAGVYDRLCGSLQLDIRHTREVLDWKPPVSVAEEIDRTVHWFLHQEMKL